MITVDELRAAGALDVPAAGRKSLRELPAADRSLFDADDTADAEKQAAAPDHEDGDTGP